MIDSQSIVGTWKAHLAADPQQTSIFRILEDLRYVSIFEDTHPDAKHQWIPMRLWGSIEDESFYRLRPRKNDVGWTRKFHFDGDTLVFQTTNGDFKEWRCTRIFEDQIPDWFTTRIDSVINRPWK